MKSYLFIIISTFVLNICFAQTNDKLERANTEFFQGNYDEAVELYSEIIDSHGSLNRFDAHYGRAYCYYKLKEDTKAKCDVKKALGIKKKHKNYDQVKGSSYWLYSLILSRKKTSGKSVRILKKSSHHISSSLLYSTIGFEEIYLERYEDAVNSLKTSIQLDTNNAWAYSNRALAYLKLGQLELARIDITRSIKLDNQNPFAYKHSAMIYSAAGNDESACLEIDKAIKLKTSDGMAEHNLDEVEELKKEYCSLN